MGQICGQADCTFIIQAGHVPEIRQRQREGVMLARYLPITLAAVLLVPAVAGAHCDSLDGPVVKAAERALSTGDVTRALVWVTATDEGEIRTAFDSALAVRSLGDAAKQLADRYFFETVVRLHRKSEGEPYTGLQPAGRDIGPVIPAADRAIRELSPEPLIAFLTQEMAAGVREHFEAVLAARVFPGASIDAARRYVHAYVEFLHTSSTFIGRFSTRRKARRLR
jgi:hypothetical protein